uniref:Ankyrin repeat domain 33Aa n=1 Tax=Sphaeramia orbicularis TaxID=375764 RepID=A0A672Y4L4_9TELE
MTSETHKLAERGVRMATANDDPHLGEGPSDILLDDSDSDSVLSDDSVLPVYETDEKYTEPAKTVYEACVRNDRMGLERILERGVTKEEAMELDINGRNGLMLAVSKGFIDIVSLMHVCPFIDINHQDNDGNTALMIAAQSGMSDTQVHNTSMQDFLLHQLKIINVPKGVCDHSHCVCLSLHPYTCQDIWMNCRQPQHQGHQLTEIELVFCFSFNDITE